MSKYTAISQALLRIDEAKFQIICNLFLSLDYKGDIKSPGTVAGKLKTRKGKPDAYIRLENDTYILAEYTTKDKSDSEKAFIKKLETDLKDCKKTEILGIRPDQVNKIVICCNSVITSDLEKHLVNLAHPFKLRLLDIHSLTTFLITRGKSIARDELQINFGTNQILNKNEFLEHYHKKNLATRLDTVLFGRENDRFHLLKALKENDIIIIRGSAGVGKSRLALQVIDDFIEEEPEYRPFYIFSKNDNITEDLIEVINDYPSGIFLIDDANRQIDNFLRLIARQLETNSSQIKIVLTVRDYAFEQIKKAYNSSGFFVHILQSLTEHNLRDILVNNNFIYNDSSLLNRIINISKGNPRLAIMAAITAWNSTDSNLLNDVSSIYDAYFQSIIDDKEVFNDPLFLKSLGLLSYFNALDMESAHAKEILNTFGFNYENFMSTVDLLHDMELVEIYETYTIKITEQVLATYFFYNVFIKKKLLSFSVLLNKYLLQSGRQMKENFYSAFNSFGEFRVLKPVKEFLLNYYQSIKNDNQGRQIFFDVFGIYFPSLTFSHINNEIESLKPAVKKESVYSDYGDQIYYNVILNQLQKFYESKSKFDLTTAIELTLKYAEKRSNYTKAIVKSLSEKLTPQVEDNSIFERQTNALELFELKSEDQPLQISLSVSASVFLNSYYTENCYTSKSDNYYIHPILANLRERTWNLILKYFPLQTKLCIDLIINYVKKISYSNHVLLSFDQPFLEILVTNHFDPSGFDDTIIVHELINELKQQGIKSSSLTKQRKRFNPPAYKLYKMLAWDPEDYIQLRRQNLEYEQINTIKIERISSLVTINTLNDFERLYPQLMEILLSPLKIQFRINFEINILLASILIKSPELGITVLKFYLTRGNVDNLNPVFIYLQCLKIDVKLMTEIYQFASENTFPQHLYWQEQYFAFLPEENCGQKDAETLLTLYNIIPGPLQYFSKLMNKFSAFDSSFPERLLTILLNRRQQEEDFIYKLDYQFFINNPSLLAKQLQLCKQLYFDQLEIDINFDSEKEEFFEIFNHDPSFFQDVIDKLLQLKHQFRQRNLYGFNKIWNSDSAEEIVYAALFKLISDNWSYHNNDLAIGIFSHLDHKFNKPALGVLKKIINNFPNDIKIINAVLEIVRNALPKHYHEIITYYLSLNDDIDLFKSIKWHNSHFTSSGHVSWDDFKAKVLTGIVNTIKQMPGSFKFLDHIDYLDKRIIEHTKRGEEERKMWFMGIG